MAAFLMVQPPMVLLSPPSMLTTPAAPFCAAPWIVNPRTVTHDALTSRMNEPALHAPSRTLGSPLAAAETSAPAGGKTYRTDAALSYHHCKRRGAAV